MRDLGTLHSPQHRGYPDASSRPLPPSEGETLPDLPPTPVPTAEGQFHAREKDQLRARVEWLENRLQEREETISDQADEIARLNAQPYVETLRRIASVRVNMPDQYLARAVLGLPRGADEARAALKRCANS